ncbi:hypothetical protein BpHYR1_022787 [Brachionus plicatilis]|uniref:Uncharacterized protein n=1 Tax=Brachionus plicatilis TaxID=10195 RepID=A0A3M7QKT5_BRAPC|nr:hypothetical protein BpHYR1_022787 [Brachionus plicatilis]
MIFEVLNKFILFIFTIAYIYFLLIIKKINCQNKLVDKYYFKIEKRNFRLEYLITTEEHINFNSNCLTQKSSVNSLLPIHDTQTLSILFDMTSIINRS